MKFGKLFVVALGCLVLVPAAALAQSSMAGQVTDNTGGVLPGVTVEAASPALIEGARVVVTDGTGQYNVIDLRPGTYSLTFTLPGFGTQVRDELVLIAEQAMTIDVAMSVGAVEESVTVSGESPVVDVQQVQRVEVLSREVQEAIPTGRSIWSYAQLVPGVRLSKPDVGGLSGHQQATISGPGAQRQDTVMEIDGQDVSMYIGDTWMPYLNPMLTAETSYTTTGIGAETQRGGLRINMVPKEGGNQFSGSFFVGGSPTGGWQSSNWTQRLGDLGIQSIQAGDERDGIPHLDRVYDLNMEMGGPIIQDRLWFLGSARRNIVNNQVLNSFKRDGSPGLDTNSLTSAFARLTYQITPRNKFSAGFDKLRKRRFTQHGAGDDVATAANSWTSPHYDTGTAKWTSTVSSRMLLELGFSLAYEDWDPGYQPGLERTRPDGFVPCLVTPCFPAVGSPGARLQMDPDGWYGVVNHDDNRMGLEYEATELNSNNYAHAWNYRGSVSYVTGSHNFKVGFQNKWGFRKGSRQGNGNLYQLYSSTPDPFGRILDFVDANHFAAAANLDDGLAPGLTGIAEQVIVYNLPVFSKADIDYDAGIYGQDSWTVDRLTLNYGLRVDFAGTSVPALGKSGGRFGPDIEYPFIDLPSLGPDFSPRASVAYDLFGDARTALKFGWNRYVSVIGESFPRRYAPSVLDSDARDWFDLALDPATGDLYAGCTQDNVFAAACLNPYGTNGDDIAQDWEIGAPGNANFGLRETDRPDPNLERQYNQQFSVGIQQELTGGVSVNAMFRHRTDHDTQSGDNELRSFANFTSTTTVARPLPGNGSFDILNIDPAVRSLIDEVDRTRADGSYSLIYNGFEVSVNARLPGGGTIFGGWTIDQTNANDCQDEIDRGDDPNSLRYCDQNAYPHPYRHELKVAGSLPFSLPGVGDLNAGFAVLGIPGLGSQEEFRYSRSSSTNDETAYIAPFYTAETCVAPCVFNGRFMDRSDTPVIGTSTSSFTATIIPDDSVKWHPRLTQVDVNIAKVFNIAGWRYDARLEMFNLLNNDADRSHSTRRGTSVGGQSSTFERASTLIDARVFRVAVTARF